MTFWKKNKTIILITISVTLYFIFAYFLERTQFNFLFLIWISLFICFYFLIQNKQISFLNLVGISIFFRIIFLFSTPNLSQDFYRFIWDGRMILEGFNPYLSLPESFINNDLFPINQANELYQGMGKLNGSHYTNYPPLNQLCFLIPALFSSKSILGSIVVMRILIILADIGIIYFGKKILERLQLPIHNIFLYALNPFIIIELTGNLHFEPVMLFFLVWSFYKLEQGKWLWSSILFACSVSIKLIPLLFLPLFYQFFMEKKSTINNKKFTVKDVSFTSRMSKLLCFYTITVTTFILLFIPFYSSTLIANYTDSVGLWFRNFEFNASIYYVFREIGYLFRGWNEIAIIGKVLPVLTVFFIGIITFFRENITLKQLITALLIGISFYYFTSTTMHPWYLATLIFLSLFTKYRFAIIWSLVIVLSYQAYSNDPWEEYLWIVGIEYLVVYGYLIWELKKQNA